jgi:membrane fusion protein (multidrug efflux system)
VKEGQTVKKGQILFVIDKEPFQLSVNQAQSAVDQAKVQADKTKADRERALRLLRGKSITQARYDDAVAADKAAQAAYNGAVANLKSAKLNLSYTDVTAPIGGKIGVINFNVGEQINPSAGPITNIVGDGNIIASFSLSERTLAELRRRFSVKVNPQLEVAIRKMANLELVLNDGTVYSEQGVLTFADNAVSATVDSLRMKGSFPNPKGELISGQTVTVRITAKKPVTTIVVPQSAILNDIGGKYVLIVSESGEVSRRGVALGAELPGGRQVINGGLADGEVIVVDGVQKARPGGVVNALSRDAYEKMLRSQRAGG